MIGREKRPVGYPIATDLVHMADESAVRVERPVDAGEGRQAVTHMVPAP